MKKKSPYEPKTNNTSRCYVSVVNTAKTKKTEKSEDKNENLTVYATIAGKRAYKSEL